MSIGDRHEHHHGPLAGLRRAWRRCCSPSACWPWPGTGWRGQVSTGITVLVYAVMAAVCVAVGAAACYAVLWVRCRASNPELLARRRAAGRARRGRGAELPAQPGAAVAVRRARCDRAASRGAITISIPRTRVRLPLRCAPCGTGSWSRELAASRGGARIRSMTRRRRASARLALFGPAVPLAAAGWDRAGQPMHLAGLLAGCALALALVPLVLLVACDRTVRVPVLPGDRGHRARHRKAARTGARPVGEDTGPAEARGQGGGPAAVRGVYGRLRGPLRWTTAARGRMAGSPGWPTCSCCAADITG